MKTFSIGLPRSPDCGGWIVGCGNGSVFTRNARRAVCTNLRTRDRPVRGTAGLCALAARDVGRTVSCGRCDGSLPFPDDTFDAAVMPLVIFFVPEPARGVTEMGK